MTRLRAGFIALSFGLSLGLGAAPSAFAADMPGGYGGGYGAPVLRAPSAIVAANWDGFYVGGHLGGGWADGSYTLNNGVFTENYTYDPSTFIGGVQGGLQATWGHWLLGIEGNYTWTGLSQTATSTIAPANLATMDIKYLGAVSARLGFTLDRLMVYAKGGWAFARTYTFDRNTATGIGAETWYWDNGFVVGTGLEYQFAPGWVAGLAFDYYGFTPTRNFTIGGVNGQISNGDVGIYSFTGKVSYLFNWWR
jgi:outer membrane immunogenic protein